MFWNAAYRMASFNNKMAHKSKFILLAPRHQTTELKNVKSAKKGYRMPSLNSYSNLGLLIISPVSVKMYLAWFSYTCPRNFKFIQQTERRNFKQILVQKGSCNFWIQVNKWNHYVFKWQKRSNLLALKHRASDKNVYRSKRL